MGGVGSGPQSSYTEEAADRIVREMSDGAPLATILRRAGGEDGMPKSPSTVYDWMAERADFAQRLVRARKDGMAALEAEMLEIADDANRDYRTVKRTRKDGSDGGEYEEYQPEHVQRAKLRIETRLKLLTIWDPKRYGPSILNKHADADGNSLPPPVRNVQVVVVAPGGGVRALRNVTPGEEES